MVYKIILSGTEPTVRLEKEKEVKQWLIKNRYATESIADRYGIRNIAETQGGVMIYRLDNDTDMADGTIEFEGS